MHARGLLPAGARAAARERGAAPIAPLRLARLLRAGSHATALAVPPPAHPPFQHVLDTRSRLTNPPDPRRRYLDRLGEDKYLMALKNLCDAGA